MAVLFREDRFISARIRVRAAPGLQGPVDARNLAEGRATSAAVHTRRAARALDIRHAREWA